MPYLIVDTEGTGLFVHRNPDKSVRPSDAPGQPRMAEFAGVQLDDDFNVVNIFQQYILPIGWENEDGSPMLEMPEEAFKIHGLSMAFLTEKGLSVAIALGFYSAAVESGHVVLGFNQQHDGRQIRAELRRAGMPDLFEQTPNICAMRSIQKNYKGANGKCAVKKLNGKGGFVRLIDAAAHFGIDYPEDRHHTALEDALVTAKVGKFLHQAGLLLPAEVHYAAGYQGDKGDEA